LLPVAPALLLMLQFLHPAPQSFHPAPQSSGALMD